LISSDDFPIHFTTLPCKNGKKHKDEGEKQRKIMTRGIKSEKMNKERSGGNPKG
jgi:hypothetical protein